MSLQTEKMYFWLSQSSMSPQKKNRLIESFTIEGLYERIGKDDNLKAHIGAEQCEFLESIKKEHVLDSLLQEMDNKGINFITINDKKYSKMLSQKQVEPPCVLYYKGDINLINTTCVAVVGTRVPSDYGRNVAEKFAAEIAENGLTVVSGMATGIDAYSHNAALSAGGKTIAVLGSGLNKPTPVSNTSLFNCICKNGLVVSEYPINSDAAKYTFPERNRIISGLSHAVIIVEAASKSGSLITAERALEQNREVFAVPGNITSAKSQGTNELIKSGAKPLTSMFDILAFFNMQNTKINKNSAPLMLDIFEQKVYNQLQNGEKSLDELTELTGFSISEIVKLISALDFKGAIRLKAGNLIEIKHKL